MLEDQSFSASDFEGAASATASPEAASAETLPTPETTDDAAPVETTAAVAEVATPAVTPERPKGPIPFEAHDRAVTNARTKGKEEGAAEWRQRYGWAEQVPQADLQRWGQTADRLLSDPVKYAEDLLAELESHPTYGPQMKAQTARRLASYRQQAQQDAPPQADVQIVDANGNVIGMTYSDRQLQLRDAQRERALEERLRAEWAKTTAPLEQMRAQAVERDRRQTIETNVDRQLAEASAWPHFKQYEQQIATEVSRGASLERAYLTVFNRDIYPNLATRERATVFDHLKNKTAASTVSPSSGTTSVPTIDADKPWEQIFEEKAHLLGR